MTTQHTPGPWQFTANMYGIDRMRVFGVEAKNGFQGVANCGFGEGCEANARLIAASPELLAALAEMLALYGDHAQYDDSEEQYEAKAIEAARAAIAKATGGG